MDDVHDRGAPVEPLGWPPEPAPISADSFEIEREVDTKTGFVVTKYVNKTTGLEVGLAPTQHIQKADAGFEPPPVQVAVLEAEAILASTEDFS